MSNNYIQTEKRWNVVLPAKARRVQLASSEQENGRNGETREERRLKLHQGKIQFIQNVRKIAIQLKAKTR